MELRDLGFDAWFQAKREERRRAEQAAARTNAADVAGTSAADVARVTAVDRDSYVVRGEAGEAQAVVTGRLMFGAESSLDFPTAGDWVLVQYSGALAVVHDVLPRKTLLTRKVAGKRVEHQLIAANIDLAFIVQSCDVDFNLRRLERYLVMVAEGGIEPLILLSKSDRVSRGELECRLSQISSASIGCRVIALSNKTGAGVDQVRRVLEAGRTYCLLGSSGVGKTSLLNRLIGREVFETKTVRESDGKGRHATTRRQLIRLDAGAMLIDSPGMRELGNIGVSTGIDESFSDIRALSAKCRFANCTHTGEAGCSVLAALQKGELSEGRYRNFLTLQRESEYHQMSYVERRKKDRQFGRFCKSVMKHSKKG